MRWLRWISVWSWVGLVGCSHPSLPPPIVAPAPIAIPEAPAAPAANSPTAKAPSRTPATPQQMGGNGEAYNGPFFSGMSAPSKPDAPVASGSLERSLGLCFEKLNLNLLDQLFSDRIKMFQTFTYTGTLPAGASVHEGTGGDFRISARQAIIFYLHGDSTKYRLHAWSDLARTRNESAVKYPRLTIYVEKESDPLTDGPIQKKQGNLWLQTSGRLPSLVFDARSDLPIKKTGKLIENLFLHPRYIEFSKPVLADTALLDGFTGTESLASINLQSYNRCLQSGLQIDGGPTLLGPGGARGKSETDVSAFLPFVVEATRVRARYPQEWTVSERRKFQLEVIETLKLSANRIYEAYLDGRWDQTTANHWANFCEQQAKGTILARDFCTELHYQISDVFYRRSVEQLRRWQKDIPALGPLLDAAPDPNDYPKFRVASRLHGAGFLRAAGYVAVNPLEIPPAHWWLVFVHELAHQVDPSLRLANARHAASAIALDIAPFEPRVIKEFVENGLELGLLAEWRAWAVALPIYRLAVDKKLWPAIAPLEKYFSRPDSLLADLWNVLNEGERFTDPRTDYYANEKVAEALREHRRQLKAGGLPPTMSNPVLDER